MSWQPIETAPKDETFLLLWFPDEQEQPRKVAFWSTNYSDWYDTESASHSMTEMNGNPTHWQPLPDPPK